MRPQNRGPFSQRVLRDKDPSLLRGQNRRTVALLWAMMCLYVNEMADFKQQVDN